MDTWEEGRQKAAESYGVNLSVVEQDRRMVDTLLKSASDEVSPRREGAFAALQPELVSAIEKKKFEDYDENLDLDVRRVEENISDAIALVSELSQVRDQYSQVAKLYVETRLRAEEFFRLDDIHAKEIEEGLYKLPHIDAKAQLDAMKERLKKLEKCIAEIDEAKKDGILSKRDDFIDWQKKLAGSTYANHHRQDNIIERTGKVATFRADFEDLEWDATERTLHAEIAGMAGLIVAQQYKVDYIYKDITFRDSRRVVSRDVAYVSLIEHTRKLSPINYGEQLVDLSNYHALLAKRFAEKVRAIAAGASTVYGVDVPLPAPAEGRMYHELREWLVSARMKVLTRVSRMMPQVYRVPLVLSDDGTLVADVTPALTAGVECLLRGVGFGYIDDDVVSPSLKVQPPPGAILHPGTVAVAPPTLSVAQVMAIGTVEVRPTYSDQVWNGSPYGQWKVTMSRGDKDTNVHMYLWVVAP